MWLAWRVSVCPRLYGGGRDRSRGKAQVHQNSILFPQRGQSRSHPLGANLAPGLAMPIAFPHTWVDEILTPFVSSLTCGPQNDSLASALFHGAEPTLVRGQRTKGSSSVRSALTVLPERGGGTGGEVSDPEGGGCGRRFYAALNCMA